MSRIPQPMTQALTDYYVDLLARELAGWGCKPSQAVRLLRHFYQHDGEVDFGAVELGKELEAKIRQHIALRQSHIALRTQASDGT